MNKCMICGNKFQPSKNYPEKKTCGINCYKIYMKQLMAARPVPNGFLANKFVRGSMPFNKGKSQCEWMSKRGIEKCKETYIQNQINTASPFSKLEGRYLPHNTQQKGTVTRRKHIHRSGKSKGKVEWEYYINIDWHGNRKPNNLYRRYLWELYHQQDVPDGYIVYNLTQDDENILVENLVLVSRRELLRLNTGR